ncbi:MAG: hypothetical protein K8T20_07725, partial [Planctomycetes bacterium]|nr:hypothetical protein [Planctomycetota bacterium]
FQDHLPPPAGEDERRYGEHIGVGNLWGPMTRGYFLSIDPSCSGGPEYFVVRLYWGKRCYLDLKSRCFADSAKVSETLAAAAEAEERKWTVAAIAHFRAAGVPKADPYDVQNEQGEFHAALWLAGVLKIQETVETLRMFEKDEWFGWINSGSAYSYLTLGTRQIIHLSLRRLGEVPKTDAAVRLFWPKGGEKEFDASSYLKSAVTIPERAGRAGILKVGMNPKEVVDAIGEPDWYAADGFEYDMDAASPFTLSVEFDEHGTVSKVERRPPTWKDGVDRDRSLAR